MSLQQIILTVSAVVSALMAGLFFAYSCSVSPGLARLTDTEYLSAMQSINRAIQNPVFFTAFLGPLVLLPCSAWLCRSGAPPACFLLLVAALAVYGIGVFGITVFANVPLNNALDAFVIKGASPEALARQRAIFEARWNTFNSVRTIASAASFILLIIACQKLR